MIKRSITAAASSCRGNIEITIPKLDYYEIINQFGADTSESVKILMLLAIFYLQMEIIRTKIFYYAMKKRVGYLQGLQGQFSAWPALPKWVEHK